MDLTILHDRLSAAEKAIITIDERLDGQADPTPVIAALAVEVATLQEQLTQCLTSWQTLQSTTSTETEATTAAAEAVQAEAEAAEALAEAAEALAEAAILTATEETETDGVTEIEPEPEPERSEAAPENKTGNWLERLLAVK